MAEQIVQSKTCDTADLTEIFNLETQIGTVKIQRVGNGGQAFIYFKGIDTDTNSFPESNILIASIKTRDGVADSVANSINLTNHLVVIQAAITRFTEHGIAESLTGKEIQLKILEQLKFLEVDDFFILSDSEA